MIYLNQIKVFSQGQKSNVEFLFPLQMAVRRIIFHNF
jgi:hypothetical protein